MTTRTLLYGGIAAIVALALTAGAAMATGAATDQTQKPAMTARHYGGHGAGQHGRMMAEGQYGLLAHDGQSMQHRKGQGIGHRYGKHEGSGAPGIRGHGDSDRKGQGLRHHAGTGQGGRWNAPAEGRGMKTGPRDDTGRGAKLHCDGSCPNCTGK